MVAETVADGAKEVAEGVKEAGKGITSFFMSILKGIWKFATWKPVLIGVSALSIAMLCGFEPFTALEGLKTAGATAGVGVTPDPASAVTALTTPDPSAGILTGGPYAGAPLPEPVSGNIVDGVISGGPFSDAASGTAISTADAGNATTQGVLKGGPYANATPL